MSDTTRKAIRSEICRAIHHLFAVARSHGISEEEIKPTLTALYKSLDELESRETMEHAALRIEPGLVQIPMMLAG